MKTRLGSLRPVNQSHYRARIPRQQQICAGLLYVLLVLAAGLSWVHGAVLSLPNGSFESPVTSFADPRMDSWQKSPQPAWYSSTNAFPWDQLVGQFLNTPAGTSNHIDNVDGMQAAFLFAEPDVAIYQDYNSISGTTAVPDHSFNAVFETGKSYTLTVGLVGGGGGMSNGVPFEISLYYRDAASNMVTVAATTITNNQALFPTNTHLIDFQVRTPVVHSSDPWAGQRIGVRLASTVGFDLQGGYWDLDNVRLTASSVPNGSFESPPTSFADPRMDAWQKSPQPAWYPSTNRFPWDQLTGQFLNTPVGSSNHIDNVEGNQGAFLFALPDVSIFQDYTTVSGTNLAPSHEFNLTYDLGKSYLLTVGVLGGGGGMSNGATFQISFYYRDGASNRVTVAATTITNSSALFPTNTRLLDFQAFVPAVKASDPWVGKNIGVELASTTGFDLQGGYWDIDNVRLDVVGIATLHSEALVDGRFQFTLEGPPAQYQILSGNSLLNGAATWSSVGVVTNLSGTVTFSDTNSLNNARFYQARQLP